MAGRTEAEIAWAAGLFEGEGCITANRNNQGRYIQVSLMVGSTDSDVVERFARVVGVGAVHVRERQVSHHKPLHYWQITGKAAIPVLEALLPWLGERRGERARAALELAREIGESFGDINRRVTHCPKGHPYDEANTSKHPDGSRRCRACAREWSRLGRERRRQARIAAA